MTMRQSQVPILDCPWNPWIDRCSLRKVSCTASSASWRLPTMWYAMLLRRAPWAWYSSSSAATVWADPALGIGLVSASWLAPTIRWLDGWRGGKGWKKCGAGGRAQGRGWMRSRAETSPVSRSVRDDPRAVRYKCPKASIENPLFPFRKSAEHTRSRSKERTTWSSCSVIWAFSKKRLVTNGAACSPTSPFCHYWESLFPKAKGGRRPPRPSHLAH